MLQQKKKGANTNGRYTGINSGKRVEPHWYLLWHLVQSRVNIMTQRKAIKWYHFRRWVRGQTGSVCCAAKSTPPIFSTACPSPEGLKESAKRSERSKGLKVKGQKGQKRSRGLKGLKESAKWCKGQRSNSAGLKGPKCQKVWRSKRSKRSTGPEGLKESAKRSERPKVPKVWRSKV
jgi:hypothetical protein